MSWSITMMINAAGEVHIEATDHPGGCPYPVATRPAGGLAKTSNATCTRLIRDGLKVREDFGWNALAPHLKKAAAELILALPPIDDFDL